MIVFVKSYISRRMFFDINPEITVLELKSLIQNKSDMPIEYQMLFLYNKLLKDTDQLNNYINIHNTNDITILLECRTLN
jgi:hypothetical protein